WGGSGFSRTLRTSRTDTAVGRLGNAQLPLEGGRARIDRVGFPDQVRDALLTAVVRVHAHPRRRLALLNQDAPRRRLQVGRHDGGVAAGDERWIRAAEVHG